LSLRRSILVLALVIGGAIAPTVMSLGWYAVTKDPSMRPLSITVESLRAHIGGGRGNMIVAVVAWDRNRSGGVTQADMMHALKGSFGAKGVDVSVEFLESGVPGTWVTYRVGPSTIGPFPQSRAADGINAAVDAFRMVVPYKL